MTLIIDVENLRKKNSFEITEEEMKNDEIRFLPLDS
jgi:hypothetical protein